MRKKLLTFVLFAALGSLLVSAEDKAPDVNLLTNADFGKLKKNNVPADWNCTVKKLDKKDPKIGKVEFALIEDPDNAENKILQLKLAVKTQRFKIQIGNYRTMKIPKLDKDAVYGFSVDVRWISDDKINARPRPVLYFVGTKKKDRLKPGDKWVKVKIDYKVAKGKKNITIRLVGARVTGILELKNMKLEALPEQK